MLARKSLHYIYRACVLPGRHDFVTPKLARCVQSFALNDVKSRKNSPDSPADTGKFTDPDDRLRQPDYFNVKKLFSVKEMFQNGVHYGHMSGTLNDGMSQFIFGQRMNQLIFDLDITAVYMRDALNFLSHVVYRGGVVLFVSRDRQNAHMVEQTAIDCGEYAHTRYWQGGVFTNAQRYFGSVTRLPDVLIFLSTLNSVLEQHVAAEQAFLMNIPTIGIVDTNANPNIITFPVPGNDDSPSAVSFYCQVFKTAIQNAKKRKIADLQAAAETGKTS